MMAGYLYYIEVYRSLLQDKRVGKNLAKAILSFAMLSFSTVASFFLARSSPRLFLPGEYKTAQSIGLLGNK